MNVTFVLWSLHLTGGARVIAKVANGLVERGHGVIIVARDVENAFSMKAKVYPVRKASTPWRELQFIDVLRLSKLPDSDIMVATAWPTAYSVYLGCKGIPFYYIQHYEALFHKDALRKKLADMTYNFPFNLIVNSTWVRNILKKRFHKDGFLVNPGIDLDIFYPRGVEKEKSVKRILCLGRRAPIKGLQDAFGAMKIISKKRADVKLILYGSEPHLKSFSPIPCEYVYKPSDEELAKLYSSIDIVIVPSWFESFPLPPLEAMACGAPVITTRYGTEDYCVHEKNCLVTPPRDIQALAEAILRLLKYEDLTEKFKKEGPETAKQFTWDKTVDRVEKSFEEALKHG